MISIKTKKRAWRAFLIANWIIIGFFWWKGSGDIIKEATFAGVLLGFGRLMGLSAVYMILQQFFFMGRLPLLEKVFGLDNLVKLHHKNGKWGLLFLILHPLAIIGAYNAGSNVSLWNQFKSLLLLYDGIINATIGLGLFIIVAFWI